jgi:hypothetical protein
MHGRLFYCDPDTWCPLSHSEQWDRDWGTYLVLTGYPLTIGADFRNLTPEREAMVQRLLPPLNGVGRPRDLWERPVPMVLEQRFSQGDEDWRVVGLFNWRDLGLDARVNLDRLWDESAYPEQGFPADPTALGQTRARYLAYDFWAEEFLGERDGLLDLTLPANSGRAIALRLAQPRPQIISIGSHIGQGAEELVSAKWDAAAKALTGVTRGRRGAVDTTIRLRVPEDWRVLRVSADGRDTPFDRPQPEVCRFTVEDRQKPVTWRAEFEGQPSAPPPLRAREPGLVAETDISEASIAALRGSIPGLAERLVGAARMRRHVPPGIALAHYARPGTVMGEPYDPRLGFGLVAGTQCTATTPGREDWPPRVGSTTRRSAIGSTGSTRRSRGGSA